MTKGRFSEALPLAQRAIAIVEKVPGSEHPDLARALNAAADLYRILDHYTDAEPLYERSLAIREKALGPDHPDVAQSLDGLASLYIARDRCHRRRAFIQAIADDTREGSRSRSPGCREIAEWSRNSYTNQGRYADAEQLYKRSLTIERKDPWS